MIRRRRKNGFLSHNNRTSDALTLLCFTAPRMPDRRMVETEGIEPSTLRVTRFTAARPPLVFASKLAQGAGLTPAYLPAICQMLKLAELPPHKMVESKGVEPLRSRCKRDMLPLSSRPHKLNG